MKKMILLFFALPALLFVSCEALPFNYSRSQAWFIPEPESGDVAHNEKKETIKLAAVKVDRTGGWDSIEKEFTALAPLCFWEQGYRMVSGESEADYIAEIQVREREFSSGWRTRRSLAVEVRLWQRQFADTAQMPFAAGRTVTVGDSSFASSDTAGRMLAQAVKKAVKKLPQEKKEE